MKNKVTIERIEKVSKYLTVLHANCKAGIKVNTQELGRSMGVAKHISMIMFREGIISNKKGKLTWDSIPPTKQMSRAIIVEANIYASKKMKESRDKKAKSKRVPQWTAREISFLTKNYSTMTNIELSRKLGRTPQAIATKRVSLGLRKRDVITDFKSVATIIDEPKTKSVSIMWGLININY